MSEEIFFNGLKYISASDAAEICHLTRDYVARLAREKKILGRQIGRNWYVNDASLKEFLFGQEYQNLLRRKELVRERKEEYKAQAGALAGAASLAQAAVDTQRKVASAAVNGTAQLASRANAMLANSSAHLPYYAVSPGVELLHKVAAAVLSVLFFIGVFAVSDALIKNSPSYSPKITETPSHEVAAVGGFAGGTFASILETMQRGVYAFMAPFWGGQGASQPIVAVQIVSKPLPVQAKPAEPSTAPAATVRTSSRTIVQQPIIQKIYQTEPLAVSGGVTEEELNLRLQQLDNKLSSQIFNATAANSTAIAQNYNVTAQTNAIDKLDGTTITNASISGGSISNANISGGTISGAVFMGTTTLEALTVTGSATSSYAGGINITGGCVSVNGNCIGTGLASNPGGSDMQVEFNNQGAFAGSPLFTFSTSTATLAVLNASTTNFTATNATSTSATTTNLYVSGAIGLGSALPISSGGTGTSSVPSYGELLVGNGNGGYSLLATSSLGIVGGSGGSGGGGTSNVSTSSENTWSALQIFAGNASSSNFSNFGTAYFGGTATSSFNSAGTLTLANLTNALLSANGSGQVVATTSIGTNVLTGSLGSINGQTLTAGGSVTITAASSTLLANNNTFSGSNVFSSVPKLASLTGLIGANAGSLYQISTSSLDANITGNAGTVTNGVYTTTFGNLFAGQLAGTTTDALKEGSSNLYFTSARATANFVSNLAGTTSVASITALPNLSLPTSQLSGTISNSQLTNNSITVNGTTFALGDSKTITAASSTLLADENNWTGLNNFSNASDTLATLGTTWISGITSSLLKTDSNGKVVAATAGTDYATPSEIAGAYPFALSGNATSTLTQFNGGLTAFASSTIGNGTQNGGLTINGGATTTGSAYIAGNLGIGTNTPTNPNGAYTALQLVGVNGYPTIDVKSGDNVGGAFFQQDNNAGNSLAFGTYGNTNGLAALFGVARPDNSFIYTASGGALTIGTLGTQNLTLGTNSTANVTIQSGGNVGIGTTSPWKMLSVAGDIIGTNVTATGTLSVSGTGTSTFTNGLQAAALSLTGSATSTAANGIDLTSGCFSVNGTCVGGSGSSASSTLLADNNTFSGSNTFTKLLDLSGGASTTQLSVFSEAYFGGTATTSIKSNGDVSVGGVLSLGTVTSCSGGQALQTDGSGNISCGTIATGGASSGGGWTTNNTGRVSLSTTTDFAVVGASTTPYAKFTVLSGANATTTFALVPAASQTANIMDIYAPGGGVNSVFTASDWLGIGTTSPAAALSVGGNGYLTGGLGVGVLNTTAGTLQTSGNATVGGALTVSGTGSSTFAGPITPAANKDLMLIQPDGNLRTYINPYLVSGNHVQLAISTSSPSSSLDGFHYSTIVGGGLYTDVLAANTEGLNSTFGIPSIAAGSNGNGSTSTAAYFYGSTGSTGLSLVAIDSYDNSLDPAAFRITGNRGAIESMYVSSNGLTGLGTTSPKNKFAVSGAASIGADYNYVAPTNGLIVEGNVGIGTSTPGSLLSLGGLANFTTATSSFYSSGGINLAGGCFSINGTCIGGSSASSTLLADNNTFSGSNVFTKLLNLTGGASTTQLSVFNNAYFGATATSSFNSKGQLNLADQGTTGSTLVTLGGVPFVTASTSAGNTSFGYNALPSITSGSSNTAFGYLAMQFSTSSTGNVAIGQAALQGPSASNGTTGSNNVAIGQNALNDNATGGSNIGIGYFSLTNNSSGNYNVGIGQTALESNTSGGHNVAIGGLQTMLFNQTGDANISIGYSALRADVSGSGNVALGDSAGIVATGQNNTLLGYSAGSSLLSGSSNIIIGANVDAPASTTNAQLNIGNVLYGSNIYSNLFAQSSAPVADGAIGIGTTTPWAKLSIHANNGDTKTMLFAIASSTASATTTLFSISNTGILSINPAQNTGDKVALLGTNTFLIASTTADNTALGITSLNGVTSGTNNIAFGDYALRHDSTGSNNVAIGPGALSNNSTGGDNIGIGSNALNNNDGNCRSVGIGTAVLEAANGTCGNVAIGYTNLRGLTTGGENTALGYNANAITTGSYNILLGGFENTGGSITTGSNNVIIGHDIGLAASTSNNQLDIQNILFGTNNSTTGTGGISSGQIGIGTTTPWARLAIQANNGDTNTTLFAIASSTASATTTLFSVDNQGNTTINGAVGVGTPASPNAYKFIVNGDVSATGFYDYNNGAYYVDPYGNDNTGLGYQHSAALAGNVGIGTTTPSSKLVVNAMYGDTNQNLLVVSSSTNSGTTQFFTIDKTGVLNLNPAQNSHDKLALFNGNSFIVASSSAQTTAIGQGALAANVIGTNITAIGYGALGAATNTLSDTAVGSNALASLNDSSGNSRFTSNTAVGFNSLYTLAWGQENVAVGASAGNGITSGLDNVAIGYRPLFSSNTGSSNVSIGAYSLYNMTSGGNNTVLGYQAGNSLTSGSNNILIGANVDAPSNTGSQQLNIGNILFGTNVYNGGTPSGTPTTNGAIGIGTTTPWARLAVQANNGDTNTTLFAIASSTASATTTLFSISNTGALALSGLGNFNGGASTTQLSVFNNFYAGGTATTTIDSAGNVKVGGTLTVNGTATSTFSGNLLVSGNIVPSADNTYSLGLASSTWKDVFIGPGSLYVNGQEVIHTDASQNVIVSSDVNENLELKTSGTANVMLNPSGSGQIQLAGPVQVSGGKNVTTSDSSALLVPFGVAAGNLIVSGNAITTTNTNGGISLTPNGNGGSYFTSGNVGIGTTNPGSKLEVEGTVTAQTFSATSTTATSTFANGINITGGCLEVGGTCLSNGVTSVSNSDGTLTISPTSGAVVASLALAHANSWTGLQQFANASTTLFSAYGPAYFGATATSSFNSAGQLTLANLTSAVLGVNTSGQVIATTSIGANYITGVLGTINGTSFSRGDSITVTAASSTLLADNNTFSGTDVFSNTLTLGNGFISQASSTFTGALNASDGLTVSGATSTFAGGITLTSGCVFYNGSCIGANSGTVNSGTAGQLAYYATNGTTISATSSLFLASSGNVGIGTSTPGDISGASRYLTLAAPGSGEQTSAFELAGNSNTVNGTLGRISFLNQTGWTEDARISTAIGSDTSDGNLIFSTGNFGVLSEAMRIDQNQNVGIGTTSPGSLFSVANSANFVSGATSTIYNGLNVSGGCVALNGTCLPTSNASSTLLADNNTFSGSNTFSSLLTMTNGLLATASSTIGNGNQNGGLTISGGATTTGNFLVQGTATVGTGGSGINFLVNGGELRLLRPGVGDGSIQLTGSNVVAFTSTADLTLNAGNVEKVRVTSGGNVGIGTTTPWAKLAIQANNGDINTTLFAIASSTASATTTLFSINNTGVLALNPAQQTGDLVATFGGTSFLTASTTGGNTGLGLNVLANITSGAHNSGFGQGALFFNDTGSYNAALGASALAHNHSGTENTGSGYGALAANLTGSYNSSLGAYSLYNATSTSNNTAVGDDALAGSNSGLQITGTQNVAVGNNALQNFVSMTGDVAIGYNALQLATSTVHDTAIGWSALANETNAGTASSENTAVGYSAFGNATSLAQSVALGAYAGNGQAGGFDNIAIGYRTLFTTNSASGNTAIGYEALTALNNGLAVQNTALGEFAGVALTSGAKNVLLGRSAGGSLTTGSNNIAIGANVDVPGTTTSQQLNIGNVLFGTGLYNGSTLSGAPVLNGDIGIGTTTPWAKLSIHANNGDTNTTLFAIASSTASATTTLFSINNTGVLALNPAQQTGDLVATFGGTSFLTASSTAGNTVLGLSAGALNVAGSGITAFGYQALAAATSTSGDTAFGDQALASLSKAHGGTSSTFNTAIGYQALTAANDATNNTQDNVAIGASAGAGITGGADNILLGYRSMYTGNGHAESNIALGTQTLYNYTGFGSNVVLGTYGGYNLTSGTDNILLGVNSNTTNSNLTTGSQNISIGNNISLPSATADGQLDVQNILFGTNNTTTGSGLSSGQVGIGTSTPWARLSIQANNGDTNTTLFAIASSTASATTTLFSVDNQGNTTINGAVGVGTPASPNAYKFIVNGDVSATGFYDYNNGAYYVDPYGNDNTGLGYQHSAALAGNVGIGTTTPSSKLVVNAMYGDTNQNLLVVSSSTNSGTTQFFTINKAGLVGIGSSTPNAVLTIDANKLAPPKSTALLRLQGQASQAAPYFNITDSSGNDIFDIDQFGTLSSTHAIEAPEGLFTTNSASNPALDIRGVFGGGQTADLFDIHNADGGPVTDTFNNKGYLGIGTSTPYGMLALSADNGSVFPGNNLFIIASSTASATTTLFSINNTGVLALNPARQTDDLVATIGGTTFMTASTTAGNVSLGSGALSSITNGSNNTAFGVNALAGQATGADNTALGTGAMQYNDGVARSVGIGSAALQFGGSGNGANVGIGYESLREGGSGGYNTAIGYTAGYGVTGAYNIILGAFPNTSDNITNGNNNIIIGHDISVATSSYSNSLNVQNILFGTNNSGSGVTPSTGQIGIGTSTPWARLSIQANNGDTNTTLFAIASSTASATTTIFGVSNTGVFTYGKASTSTIPDNTSYAWTIATSSTATPLFKIDSTTGSEGVSVGSSGGDVYIGDTGSSANLIFQNSGQTLKTAGGGIINIGAGTDIVDFGVNVGIGTSSPGTKLDVYNTSSGVTTDAAYFTNAASGTSTASRINFRAIDVNGLGTTTGALTGILQQNYNGGKGDLALSTLNSGTLSEVMRLTAAGNVGIGTTTPWAKLAISANNGDTNKNLFLVSSSTASATTTLFSVDNAGNITAGGGNFSVDGSGNVAAADLYVNTATQYSGLYVQSSGAYVATLYGSAGGNDNGQLSLFNSNTQKVSLVASGSSYLNGGNLGIGTSTPWATLAISANNGGTNTTLFAIASSTASATTTLFSISNTGALTQAGGATSTFSNGFNITAGCFSVNGTCVGGGTSGSGGGQLLATYGTSTPGSNVSVNFNGASGSSPSFSGGTLTLPSNTSYVTVEIWGGGGGGGGADTSGDGGGGGGGGGYSTKLINNPSGTYYYTVGAGGASSADNSNGNSGSATCFGSNSTACTSSLLSAAGGGGGGDGGASGPGGSGSSGDVNMTGSSGGVRAAAGCGGPGGSAPGGGGGGNGGCGASSAGSAFGGGGGGGYNGNGGAAGGAGGIVINVYTTGISNGSVGSGTAGQFAFYNGTGSDLSATSSLFASTAGLIGIGTTTPWAQLSVTSPNQQSGSLPLFSVASTTGTHLFEVLGNGSVGIGTTSPTSSNGSVGNLAEIASAKNSVLVLSSSGGAPYSGIVEGRATSDVTSGDARMGQIAFSRLTDITSGKVSGAIKFDTTNDGTISQQMIIDNSGNVGIGTTSPGSLLSLGSLANFTTATSTFYSSGGINLTSGCFSINGTCVGGGGSGSGTVSSGTQGQFAFYNAAGTTVSGTSTLSLSTSGLLTFNGSLFNYANDSTTTIPNNAAYAWTIATSSTAAPLFKIDTTSGSENVSIGSAGSDVYIGDTGSSPNLVFQNSGQTIRTANGGLLNIGAGTDSIDFGGSGGVGIGTSTPATLLSVAGSGYLTGGLGVGLLNTTAGTLHTSGAATFGGGVVGGSFTTSGGGSYQSDRTTFSAGNYYVLNGSSVGVVLPNGNTAWSAQSDERLKTNVTPLSSEGDGLSAIEKLNPISFNWKESGASTSTQLGFLAQQVQQVFPELVDFNPNATTTFTPNGTYYLDYEGLISPTIAAVQNINAVFNASNASTSAPSILSLYQGTTTPIAIDSLGDLGIGTSTATTTTNLQLCLNGSCVTSFPYSFSATSSTSSAPTMTLSQDFLTAIENALSQWFANATNGIQNLFANTIHTNEICVSDATGSSTCLTKAQLDQLLAGASAGSSSAAAGTSADTAATSTIATTTAPILQINGNNPATVSIGATYADLGATITGPTADLNLGVQASVDGATSTPVSSIHIDTSKAGTHTITYSATDQNGVTGSAVRTVVVVDPNAATSTSTTSTTTAATSTSSTSSTTTSSTSSTVSSASTPTTTTTTATSSPSTTTSSATPTTPTVTSSTSTQPTTTSSTSTSSSTTATTSVPTTTTTTTP